MQLQRLKAVHMAVMMKSKSNKQKSNRITGRANTKTSSFSELKILLPTQDFKQVFKCTNGGIDINPEQQTGMQ